MELPCSGRCQCGALSYQCSDALAFTVNGHCRACQPNQRRKLCFG